MNETVYLKMHAKAERHEKQMKNSDRERAQHEKYQLEKLLEDLRGPDWLKTLGITGVTDSEKKRYEPKRALFIRETHALIDKFKRWKEEEKRRKLEREQEILEAAMEEAEDGAVEHEGSLSESRSSMEDDSLDSASTHAPDSSELDALASQQLIEEERDLPSNAKDRHPSCRPSLHHLEPSCLSSTNAIFGTPLLLDANVAEPFLPLAFLYLTLLRRILSCRTRSLQTRQSE